VRRRLIETDVARGLWMQCYVPRGGIHGWLASIVRSKGARAERYYVAVGDEQAALLALRVALRLGAAAEVSLRHALSREDILVLKLRIGQVRKA